MENFFEYYNPNPTAKVFKNGKPKAWTKEDNAVRVICMVTGKSWEDAYDMLTEEAKKLSDMPSSKEVVAGLLAKEGYMPVSVGKPKTGERRPTVAEFCSAHKNGKFILNIASVMVPVSSGRFLDTEDRSDSSVYSWFEHIG
jgi:hypothetical protein